MEDSASSSDPSGTPMDGIETNGETNDEPSTFSNFSIAIKASAIGIEDLPISVCQYVAEELSYKMRELIYTAKFIMGRNKRTTLTNNDVKKAMKLLGGCEVFGHNTREPSDFVHIPELDLFVEKDSTIDVIEAALEETVYEQRPEPYIQGAWVMPEGYAEESTVSPTDNSYYRTIAKTILSGNPAHIRVALRDLRTNAKIGPLCPYFLNLVALAVKMIGLPENRAKERNEKGERSPQNDTVNLTNTLISTVHAIAHNRFVDPSPYKAVNRAVDSLLKLVIETDVAGKGYDDLAVRFRAGLLLAKVVITWSIELKQQMDIVRRLLQHLLDPELPLQTHYGAIVALTALGQRTYDFYFWPVIERYLPQLELRADKNPDVMVQHVMAAILVAARSTHQKEPASLEQLLKLYRVDQKLYSMFGDSVTPLRMATNSGDQVYCVKPSDVPAKRSAQEYRFRISHPVTRRKAPVPLNSVFEPCNFTIRNRNSSILYPQKSKHSPFAASKQIKLYNFVPYRRLSRRFTPTARGFSRISSSGDLLWVM